MEMTTELKQKLEDAVWAAHSLFENTAKFAYIPITYAPQGKHNKNYLPD